MRADDLDNMTYVPEASPTLRSAAGGASRGKVNGTDRAALLSGDWPVEVAPTLNTAYADKLGLEDQHVDGTDTYRLYRGESPGGLVGVPIDVAPTLDATSEAASTDRGARVVEHFQKVVRPQSAEHPDVWEARDVAATLNGFDQGDARAVDVVVALQDGRGLDKAQNGSGVCTDGVGYTLDGTGAQGVAHPLTAEGHDASEDGTGRGVPLHTDAVSVRRLTPTECERLQGFPDGWTDAQADSARYRQLGNAVAVPVVAWVGARLLAVEAGEV